MSQALLGGRDVEKAVHKLSLVSSLVGAITLAAHISGVAAPAAFVPNDIQVCPASAQVLDPEFDSRSQLMTFMDARARLRVTSIKSDGMVGPAGCAGRILDQGSWGFPGNVAGYNGPEWGRSQEGLEIYFVKFLSDGVTPSLARAWANGGGWQTELLANGEDRATILVSTNDTDPQARLMYLRRMPSGALRSFWRESTEPTETIYPGAFNRSTGNAPRWIAGQRAISLVMTDSKGVSQAARYWIDTKTMEQLTSDAGNKSEVWIWSAPEFGGDLVLTTVVDGCCLRVYRQLGETWTLVNTIDAPSFSGLTSIFSPEPIVYRGRSYVALQVGNELMDPASQIWVTSIDPAAPLLRQVSEPGVAAIRTEPEWMLTLQGAFVYYSQQDTPRGKSLRRAATGLR